jgi:excisionase family DNA binding protein
MSAHAAPTSRVGGGAIEPLAVPPRQACLLLGIGNTRLYQLIDAGELVSYNEGRARRVTMASIRARVARLAGTDTAGPAPQPRRRGRPRKLHDRDGDSSGMNGRVDSLPITMQHDQ